MLRKNRDRFMALRPGVRTCVLALGLAAACGPAAGAQAQRVETPVAREFAVRADNGTELLIGLAEPLPGGGPHLRVGFIVRCERASGLLEAFLSFGTVPAGKPVQIGVRHPEDGVERFGPVVRGARPGCRISRPEA